MKSIIVNADDCGMSQQVNSSIEEAIKLGKITSTTIMANMNDFNGAVRLYNDYKDVISFGWHINLTEGKPLLYSQLLLDCGYYKEEDGQVFFNSKQFGRNHLNKGMQKEIKNELIAQFEKLKVNGIDITHADSHHHIHTSPGLLMLMPFLLKELNINRCRNIRNYGVSTISYVGRKAWSMPFRLWGIRMPDTLTSFSSYYQNPHLRQGSTVELECHPGHPKDIYQKEMKLIYSTDLKEWEARLITYKDL